MSEQVYEKEEDLASHYLERKFEEKSEDERSHKKKFEEKIKREKVINKKERNCND